MVKLTWIVVLAMTGAGIVPAAPRYIGMVTSEGRLWVDSAGVSTHATLFEGSVVETQDAMARLQLAGGVRVLLDEASRARLFQDHLLLEKGRAQLDKGAAFRIEARALEVVPARPESRAVVSMRDPAIEVGALNGEVQVRNARGILIARVSPARAVELQPDLGGASLVTGCLSKLGNRIILEDEVSGVIVELRGEKLDAYAGKRVQLTGQAVNSRAEAPADEVIHTSEVKVLEIVCSAAVAASTGAAATGSRERIMPGVSGGASVGSAGISAAHAALEGVAVASSTAAGAHIVAPKRHRPPISGGR